MPQVLKNLAETTRVASIQASTAIEGYDVPTQRAEHLARRPDAKFRNRNEQEFAGYRDAIDELVRDDNREPVTPALPFYLATRLHRYTTGELGRPKTEQNYIASYENGTRRIVFTPVAPHLTESTLRSLVAGYNDALVLNAAHPVLLHGLFTLDFLAIHPVADGTPISRLLTVHELLRLGYGVARYVSIEQLILESKNGYYDVLEASRRDARGAARPVALADVLCVHPRWAYDQFEQKISASRARPERKPSRHATTSCTRPRMSPFAEANAALPGISSATLRQC